MHQQVLHVQNLAVPEWVHDQIAEYFNALHEHTSHDQLEVPKI